MLNKNEQQIIDSIKQILNLYKIDINTVLSNTNSSEEEINFSLLIEKTQERIEELNKKTQDILSKTGLSEKEMELYASNPDNFSNEEWTALQQIKKSCDNYQKETEDLLKSIDKTSKKTSSLPPLKPHKKKNKKKNWIPL